MKRLIVMKQMTVWKEKEVKVEWFREVKEEEI
jgi:hypothetical protein